ncbi:hypothetical protein EYY92_04910 [Hafnia alvei]|nr:hypothetical protein EYY92_04910 [Hafnia alvei]TBL85154.1 hypothetical protein EYY88_13450 [Hafnia alvei]TBL95506.1 hypothetical protein EYY90_07415 [Hafnia alvei]
MPPFCDFSTPQTDIILAVISSRLNLYAKKFRCLEVLTSIFEAINLYSTFTRHIISAERTT